jgi:hypothetical protein
MQRMMLRLACLQQYMRCVAFRYARGSYYMTAEAVPDDNESVALMPGDWIEQPANVTV